ncbi:MAG: fibrillarin-like rRNA/tRNA 2'-O-methyltransferase [Candidatus Poseidoniaceae archaeon]|jgi:fibrillarin-like rRNA methylase|nr:fibrillarin-like rRNA/tRNA 2'-O-methyltransferase [Candidatus Poseidoniaceae archaeon]
MRDIMVKKKGGGKNLSWAIRMERRGLWTRNAVVGVAVHGESLRRFSGIEYRRWDPRRSKLAAGILRTNNDPSILLPDVGSNALYLGAGHGTTVSHLHDHLCGEDNSQGGRIVAIDIAPRCMRDLIHLSKSRKGLVPVLGDARKYTVWGALIPQKVRWIFQDVAQAAQVEIFLSACERFLARGGIALLSLKAASERFSGDDEETVFTKVGNTISASGFELLEAISLTGFEEQHTLFVAKKPN